MKRKTALEVVTEKKAVTISDILKDSISITHDNSKTGIDSINLLAGPSDATYTGYAPAAVKACPDYNTLTGTCSSCNGAGPCPECYARKLTRYTDTLINYASNTVIAKRDPTDFFRQLEEAEFENPLVAPRVFRLHDSGDFFSFEYFSAAMDFIGRHPETRFGAYTKETETVLKYGIENLPANLSLSDSPWPGHCEPVDGLPHFYYDDRTNDYIKSLPHCPAVDKNGKRTGVKCAQCLHCYIAKPGDAWAVYKH